MIKAALLALTFAVANVTQAGLGWSLEQTEKRYGAPIGDPLMQAGITFRQFQSGGYRILAGYYDGTMLTISYESTAAIPHNVLNATLGENLPGAIWDYKGILKNLLTWEAKTPQGVVLGAALYGALKSDDGATRYRLQVSEQRYFDLLNAQSKGL